MSAPLLSLHKVSKIFEKPPGAVQQLQNLFGAKHPPETVHATDDVSLEIATGKAVGLVGESGCGKSTVARMVMGLLSPSFGEIYFKGKLQRELSDDEFLKIQMVFQDPYSSLNPRMRVISQIREALRVHAIVPQEQSLDYLNQVFEQCGIDTSLTHRYPHQFSGGQRQRFGIARALAMQPEVMVCDEPVAALDVSIQAQVINLFMALREQNNLTYLFISHDLGVVRHLCDRVVVMYLGRIVEEGATKDVLDSPRHPYTQALKASSPRITRDRHAFEPIRGEIPSPLDPPPGCHFHPRCPMATEQCRLQSPEMRQVDGVNIRCHLV